MKKLSNARQRNLKIILNNSMKEGDIYEVLVDSKIRKSIATKTFNEGDKILHMDNFDKGVEIFIKASRDDVKYFSGRNGYYLKLI